MKFSKRLEKAKKAEKKEVVIKKNDAPPLWLKIFMLALAVILLVVFLLFVFRQISAWYFWITAGIIAIFVYLIFPKLNKQ